MNWLRRLLAPVGLCTGSVARSGRWPAVRRAHLKREPACRACGRTTGLEVHHIRPFHRFPELELDQANLLTLCASCHLTFGHFGDWRTYNPTVIQDAGWWLARMKERPPIPARE